jgi:hypothetical protein
MNLDHLKIKEEEIEEASNSMGSSQFESSKHFSSVPSYLQQQSYSDESIRMCQKPPSYQGRSIERSSIDSISKDPDSSRLSGYERS